jgi:hypothetical protein
MRKLLLAASVAAAAILPGAITRGEAATMRLLPSGSVMIDGPVLPGDAVRLIDALIAQKNSGKVTERIFLNSPGGQVVAGVQIADVINKSGIAVVVGKGRVCASICVLMLAAGKERWVYSDSKLGVHSVGSHQGGLLDGAIQPESVTDRSLTLLIARAMKGFGVPDAVIVKMITTPPDAISGINDADAPGWVNVAQAKS